MYYNTVYVLYCISSKNSVFISYLNFIFSLVLDFF